MVSRNSLLTESDLSAQVISVFFLGLRLCSVGNIGKAATGFGAAAVDTTSNRTNCSEPPAKK